MLVITHQGNTYKFDKNDETEEDNMFRDRCWWIIKNLDSKKSSKELVALSHLWVSVKYYGTSYGTDIMEQLHIHRDVFEKK